MTSRRRRHAKNPRTNAVTKKAQASMASEMAFSQINSGRQSRHAPCGMSVDIPKILQKQHHRLHLDPIGPPGQRAKSSRLPPAEGEEPYRRARSGVRWWTLSRRGRGVVAARRMEAEGSSAQGRLAKRNPPSLSEVLRRITPSANPPYALREQ